MGINGFDFTVGEALLKRGMGNFFKGQLVVWFYLIKLWMKMN